MSAVREPVHRVERQPARAAAHAGARGAKLAVFASQMGALFINHHVEDLYPGRTVAVVRFAEIPPGGFWDGGPVPILALDAYAKSYRARLARRLGRDERAQRDAAVTRFLRTHGVGIVLGEFLDEFVEFVPLLERLGIPYVAQSHGNDASAALRRPGVAESYLAYRSARAVLTRCELHRRRLIALGLAAERVHVNHGGVKLPEHFPHRPPASGKRLLAISYMVPKKGSIFLLQAFRLAAARDPALTLDYVGGGPLFPGVRQFVDACGLRDRVRLHGVAPQSIKHLLLAECGVFVQHSITDATTGDEEGLPSSIQEAMAHGLAVIATRHAGIPEAVAHGVNGLLVDEGDVEGMAAAMVAIGPAATGMGAAGHRCAVAGHGWDSERRRLLGWLGALE